MRLPPKPRIAWWGSWAVSSLPLALMVWWLATGQLTADPVEGAIRYLGEWGLRFLLIGLALTPLKRLVQIPWLGQIRRMIGLYAAFYVALHILAYAAVDQGLDLAAIWSDVVKRPYITVGATALLLLVPLVATSTNGMIRRLGWPRWKRLHRLAYAIPALGVLHYLLLVKADTRTPLIYAAIWCLLLLGRVLPPLARGIGATPHRAAGGPGRPS